MNSEEGLPPQKRAKFFRDLPLFSDQFKTLQMCLIRSPITKELRKMIGFIAITDEITRRMAIMKRATADPDDPNIADSSCYQMWAEVGIIWQGIFMTFECTFEGMATSTREFLGYRRRVIWRLE